MTLFEKAEQFKEKLAKIKVCAFDIDGVLTPGHIWYQDDEMGFNRSTHTSDGYGLKLLMRSGIKTGVISGGDSKGVKKRFIDNLKLDFAYLGDEDKREAFKRVLAEGYAPEEVLYMGDEFFDVPLLQKAGFAVTVPDAAYEVKQFVDYVTTKEGGYGAVREMIEIFRYARGLTPEVLDFDGNPIDFKSTWP
ncbi:HAD family hydrolase [Bacteriovorax sp. DB6_IX]|uniref:KdsC family phosphatase n=1 Tax=Bacteriovorax sp. DB6_IX TaxID=1353530 RepID=UPI00038A3118|nr:HAD hydrolase family protein [Bacteriovorax sp. DB6_IX]EQC52367.1 3-deoxy-D-manno-octulosonate 8-phosphate phosphatase, YrbI family [Bacteriovorax sp. DB6_IX]